MTALRKYFEINAHAGLSMHNLIGYHNGMKAKGEDDV